MVAAPWVLKNLSELIYEGFFDSWFRICRAGVFRDFRH